MSAPPDDPTPLDWTDVTRRLADIAARIEREDSGLPLADRLARRAERLAAPEPEPPAENLRDFVVFGLSGSRYALELTATLAVVPVEQCVPLPGVDPCHLGILVHRGDIHALVDPAALLHREPPAPAEITFAVLLDHPDCALALAADSLHGLVRAVPARPPAGSRPGLVGALLPDGTAVLSADALAGHARLVVDHAFRLATSP